MSKARLRARDERVNPNRRTPSMVRPSMWSNSTEEPTTSSIRGSTLTRTPACLATRMRSSVSGPPLAGRAMIARCTRWRRARPRNSASRSSGCSAPHSSSATDATTSALTRASLARTTSIVASSPMMRQRSVAESRLASRRAVIRPAIRSAQDEIQSPTTELASSSTGVTPS